MNKKLTQMQLTTETEIDVLDPEVQAVILSLPPVVEKEYEKKRYAGAPDISKLKAQQLDNFLAMQEFLRGTEGGFYLLEGYAGTGKTFTIGNVIEWYLQVQRDAMIAVTAPTNKAVKVLKNAAEFTHTNVKYLTIHSLLGLKEEITANGDQIFVQDKKNPPKIEEYNLLVVDETSMLSDDLFLGNDWGTGIIDYVNPGQGASAVKNGFKGDGLAQLMADLRTTAAKLPLKVIFMGDPAQIPPVMKPECLPFNEQAQKKYGIKVGKLTEIVRQAAGNPIIETTMKIRQAIHRPVTFVSKESQLTEDGKGVIFLQKGVPGHSEVVEKLLNRYFCSENFEKDANFAKCIAWRNKTVDALNVYIRKMLYGENAINRIMPGEKLIANKPIFDHPTILFNTNDEFEVVSHTEKIEQINGGLAQGGYDITYYETLVRYEIPSTGAMSQAIIKIVHNKSMEVYKGIIQTLATKAKNEKKGSWEAKRAWMDFFAFQENFADISYNYAITAHKSQGSTYEYAFVFENDINHNPGVHERNRIKYTACSRPKQRLFIIC